MCVCVRARTRVHVHVCVCVCVCACLCTAARRFIHFLRIIIQKVPMAFQVLRVNDAVGGIMAVSELSCKAVQ